MRNVKFVKAVSSFVTLLTITLTAIRASCQPLPGGGGNGSTGPGWNITYSSTGTFTGAVTPVTGPAQTINRPAGGGGYYDYYETSIPANGTAQLQVAATVTVTATWNGTNVSGPPTPAPAKLTLKFLPYAIWTESSSSAINIIGHSAADGFADAENVVSSNYGDQNTGTSSKYHIVTFDGSSGTVTQVVNLTAEVNCTAPAFGCSIGISYACTAAVDNRTVTLARSGAHNETVLPNGTVYGDTTYAYWANLPGTSGTPPTNITNTLLFGTVFNGGWSVAWPWNTPNVAWSWAFSPNLSYPFLWIDDWKSASRIIMDGSISTLNGLWQGPADSPTQIAVTYTAIDQKDGAQAQAQYFLTVHDPYEVVTQNALTTTYENPVQIGQNAICTGPSQAVNVYIEQAVSGTVGVAFGGDIPCSEFISPVDLNIGMNFSISYAFNAGVGVTLTDMKLGQYTYMQRYDMFNNYSGTANVWDAGGLVGPDTYLVKKPIGEGYGAHVPYLGAINTGP